MAGFVDGFVHAKNVPAKLASFAVAPPPLRIAVDKEHPVGEYLIPMDVTRKWWGFSNGF
jgi:hypothetical protein